MFPRHGHLWLYPRGSDDNQALLRTRINQLTHPGQATPIYIAGVLVGCYMECEEDGEFLRGKPNEKPRVDGGEVGVSRAVVGANLEGGVRFVSEDKLF